MDQSRAVEEIISPIGDTAIKEGLPSSLGTGILNEDQEREAGRTIGGGYPGFWNQYLDALHVAMAITRCRADAAEIALDAVVKLWMREQRGIPTDSTQAWLTTVARNDGISRLRKSEREANKLERLKQHPGGSVETPPDAAIRHEQLGIIMQAISGLPPPQRDIIRLTKVNGLTLKEAATRVGVPYGTAKSHSYYGLRALQIQLWELAEAEGFVTAREPKPTKLDNQ